MIFRFNFWWSIVSTASKIPPSPSSTVVASTKILFLYLLSQHTFNWFVLFQIVHGFLKRFPQCGLKLEEEKNIIPKKSKNPNPKTQTQVNRYVVISFAFLLLPFPTKSARRSASLQTAACESGLRPGKVRIWKRKISVRKPNKQCWIHSDLRSGRHCSKLPSILFSLWGVRMWNNDISLNRIL